MKKKITVLMLKVVLKWFTVHVASNMLKDAYYGEGFTEAIRLAHRNLLNEENISFSKELQRFDNVSPELLEIKVLAKRKKLRIRFI